MKIQGEDKVPHLLHYVGEEAFNNLCDHFGAEDPYTKTYSVLVNKLKELYAPASLEIEENLKFNCRKQNAGEDIQAFANAITMLSLTCNFGDFQKTALRNQFVFGIESKRTQSRLLETKDLNFDKAVQIAIAMELTEKEASVMSQSTSSVQYLHARKSTSKKHAQKKQWPTKPNTGSSSVTNHKSTNHESGNKITCFRCGGSHTANKC